MSTKKPSGSHMLCLGVAVVAVLDHALPGVWLWFVVVVAGWCLSCLVRYEAMVQLAIVDGTVTKEEADACKM